MNKYHVINKASLKPLLCLETEEVDVIFLEITWSVGKDLVMKLKPNV